MVTEEARLVRKYEHVRFSSLEMAFLARRFAPRPISPPLFDPSRTLLTSRRSSLRMVSTEGGGIEDDANGYRPNIPSCDERSESRKGLGLGARIAAMITEEACLIVKYERARFW